MNQVAQHYKYNQEELQVHKDNERYFAEHFKPEKEMHLTHWLNIHSLANKEELTGLMENLGLDKLLQEDVFTNTKRPRLEEYPSYIFFSIISALPTTGAKYELKKERISFMMGDNFLVSFQEKVSDHFPIVRDRLESNRGKIRSKGPDFLLFRMLEAITDNYSEVVDKIGHDIEILDKLVLRNPKSEVHRRVEWEKRKLVDLRKTVIPMKELLLQLDHVENKLIVEENSHYYHELKDTCMSLVDEIDAQKQMLEGIANLYYAIQGQRMNEVMKVLTVTSAIFIPLTFIVGVYGMNFENMPELKWKNGYFMAWGIMITIAVVLIFVFWKRGWLRRHD
ncbi:MAG: magnesium/cobalt transporter CorA [Fluviicola sp.]|nr:magnesium/cobalt transporter CorA [Fluviicola sp.]